MAETLGMLCDKLTIVKLKEFHTDNSIKLNSLSRQAQQLQLEIDVFFNNAILGKIPQEKLTFASNKVYKKEGNETEEVNGNIGVLFYQLADVNCRLWHEVEKGYDIKNVPIDEKDKLINSLAVLNLQRNNYIDAIDMELVKLVNNQEN